MRTIALAVVVLMTAGSLYAADTDKTFVSWLTMTDRDLGAGAVVSVHSGGKFDGLVYGERKRWRWMAGSHYGKRTEKDQNKNAEEPAESAGMMQVAVVYKDDTITIYRDGKVYTSYVAKNIDILSDKDNLVTMGIRDFSFKGNVAADVDDTRIYSQALTLDQLNELQPNKPSEIKPYAWWDFEDGKGVEKTGRYIDLNMFGAESRDGKLILSRGSMVIYGEWKYEAETPEWPKNPANNWPHFHLGHPTGGGGPFDPNLAVYYKGRYHLNYIYGGKYGYSYGHVSSKDMVHWKWHPTTMNTIANGHGMYSGTAFSTKEGKLAHTYCGAFTSRNFIQYAIDDNLEEWTKPEVILAKDENGQLMLKPRYFDPDIFILNDKYYALNSVSPAQAPTIMRSDNLKEWDYLGDLLHEDFDEETLGTRRREDISCPNVFKLADKWVLLCISHGLGGRYFIGEFVEEKFLPEQHGLLGGDSSRLFAPESLLTPDNRRVFWAWFRGGHIGALQSLPTELYLSEDGFMRYRPIRELEALRYDGKQKTLSLKKGETVLLEEITDRRSTTPYLSFRMAVI